MNPMKLLQLKNLWEQFTLRHPKFPHFIKAVSQTAAQEGTIFEFQVTTPDGKILSSNLKFTKEDLELLQTIREMQ